MDYEAEEISYYLMGQRYPYHPCNCPKHIPEFCGWDFRDEKMSSIKAITRCINCGTVGYGVRQYRAVGPNSFDIDDEKLVRSGLLGPHIIERKWKEEQKRVGY